MIDLFTQTLLPSGNHWISITIFIIFLMAGIVKGFLGIGLPPAAMALLTLVITPTLAISLLTLPIIATNFAQFIRHENLRQIVKKYKLMGVSIMISIFLTSLLILKVPQSFLMISIGFAMVFFSISQISGKQVQINSNKKWHILVGTISGILGGMSSIWSPPVAMFLLNQRVSKSEFIGATGFLFLAGSIPLAVGLSIVGVLNYSSAIQSLIGLVFVMVGFRIGESLRDRVSQKLFRTLVLWSFLAMGLRLIMLGVF